MRKIFCLISFFLIFSFFSCTIEDGCISYDDAIKTMFYFQKKSKKELVDFILTIDQDTICHSKKAPSDWYNIMLEDNNRQTFIWKYTCVNGEYCHSLSKKLHEKLKIKVTLIDSIETKEIVDSVPINLNYAYGIFLRNNIKQFENKINFKTEDPEIDLSNLYCLKDICIFSYRKEQSVCKETTLGEECVLDYYFN